MKNTHYVIKCKLYRSAICKILSLPTPTLPSSRPTRVRLTTSPGMSSYKNYSKWFGLYYFFFRSFCIYFKIHFRYQLNNLNQFDIFTLIAFEFIINANNISSRLISNFYSLNKINNGSLLYKPHNSFWYDHTFSVFLK